MRIPPVLGPEAVISQPCREWRSFLFGSHRRIAESSTVYLPPCQRGPFDRSMSDSTTPASQPSRPFTIGGVGHRDLEGREQSIRRLIEIVFQETVAAHRDEQLSLVCSVAEGADRLLLSAAARFDVPYDCVLPCSPACFREDFHSPESCAEFDVLLEGARSVLYPETPLDKEAGYIWASEAVLYHADLLIAVWNGKPGNGAAGTADSVARAMARGVVVVRIPIEPAEQIESRESDPEILS